MGIIRLLDENTINKIAAGEVIEKPASIVKELVENSIDAGASEISIEIRSGGISFIRIKDNGKGISREDMETAFMRHATSKITSDEDLTKVATLGFRGEALASIAAVSKIEMMSKTSDAPIGFKITIEGGSIFSREECGCPEGTVITVKEVFFNTPARLKFLKTESREGVYITDIMQNLAMSHSNISFKYYLNDKLIFATKGDNDLKSVIHSVYGKDVVKNILDVNCSRDFISVKGFIGNGNLSKGNRNYQSIFINGRYIKNKTITAAVEAAYKSMLTINKFPFFVLHIFLNPEFVDINVHPTKAEVKFQDDQIMFKSVFHCIKDCLTTISHIPIIDDSKQSFIGSLPKVNQSEQVSMGKHYIPDEMKRYENHSTLNEEIKETNYDPAGWDISHDVNSVNNIEEKDPGNNEYPGIEEPVRYRTDVSSIINNSGERKEADSFHKIPKFGPLGVVGQIHFTYIIAEGPEDMYMIDQHAAHERIYYEKYLEEYRRAGIQSQSLLVPMVLEFSISEKQTILDNITEFKKLGYEIEDFGGSSVAFRSIPVIYGNPDPKALFYEIMNGVELKEKEVLFSIDKIMYTMACKSAIKANDKLSTREMVELIEQLRFCNNPFNCPHGRPTIVKMSYFEMEKKFKRIQ